MSSGRVYTYLQFGRGETFGMRIHSKSRGVTMQHKCVCKHICIKYIIYVTVYESAVSMVQILGRASLSLAGQQLADMLAKWWSISCRRPLASIGWMCDCRGGWRWERFQHVVHAQNMKQAYCSIDGMREHDRHPHFIDFAYVSEFSKAVKMFFPILPWGSQWTWNWKPMNS